MYVLNCVGSLFTDAYTIMVQCQLNHGEGLVHIKR